MDSLNPEEIDEEEHIIQDSLNSTEIDETATKPQVASVLNVEKHKQKIDLLLGACREKMAEEVGSLLGINVELVYLENWISSREDFKFKEGSGSKITANLDVAGEIEQKSFLSIDFKDAILIGGRLILLSDSELQMLLEGEDFSQDMEDAYGEIVDIFSGVFTAVFEKEYTKQIRFIKSGLQNVGSMTEAPLHDDLIPDQDYYVSAMRLVMEGNELGLVHIFFPVDMLRAENFVVTVADVIEENSIYQPVVESLVTEAEENRGKINDDTAFGNADNSNDRSDILLIGDGEVEMGKLKNVLESRGYMVRVLSFKDNVYDFISGELKAVYLVTREIDEQALGVAIKVSSACPLPIIVAAPGWTRKKVIKAVKYGVRDILLTPATMEDIEENIANNIAQPAI